MLTHIPIYRDMLTQYTAKAFKMKDAKHRSIYIQKRQRHTQHPYSVFDDMANVKEIFTPAGENQERQRQGREVKAKVAHAHDYT